MDVRESAPLAAYDVPVVLNKPAHQPHLENFFAAIRGDAELNCPRRTRLSGRVCDLSREPSGGNKPTY